MKLSKLKQLEMEFFEIYPDGFQSAEMVTIGKKHKMDKMMSYVAENFSEEKFDNEVEVFDSFVKLISKSSLVSVFEKTKFKNEAKAMSPEDKHDLVSGLYTFLYEDQKTGFERQVSVLRKYKMAKWPILTVVGLYMDPKKEVLIKPTTVKAVMKYFEVEEFEYTSKANYVFYDQYRSLINQLKSASNEHLQSIDNGAFGGFLMMTIK